MDRIKENEITGSHEEFWTFSQVSQWGSHWGYSSQQQDHLHKVLNIVIKARSYGIKYKYQARLVHYAQLLIWRFYLKENMTEYPPQSILPLAFECSSQILEVESPKNNIANEFPKDPKIKSSPEFKLHFNLVTSLDFNIRIHHPSDYLQNYITSTFTEAEFRLAETIISDSFMVPVCLVHRPSVIAEGSAIMAAAMLNKTDTVIPKSTKALSFIQDMKCFYKQKYTQK